MIPAAFAYERPSTVEEALGLLQLHAGSAKLLAGGQSLLPLMKLRVANVERLIDIGRLAELRGIRRLSDGRLAVGALTTYREMLESEDVMRYGLLRDALPGIADVQVRNRGTIGGSLAHADPASDMPAIVLALDAEIAARSVRGRRVIRAVEFFEGPFQSALAPDELVTEVILPAGRDDAGSAYRSLEQPASGYSIVGVAAVVFGDAGRLTGASVAITGVSGVAYRATAVEQALAGRPRSGLDLAAASRGAVGSREVNEDIHADRAYRARMAEVYTRRALEAALARLG